MTMSQMAGAKLAEKLKEIRFDIPVIICTGHSAVIDEEKAKQLGIAGFVMKPVLKLKIAKAIRDVLDKQFEISKLMWVQDMVVENNDIWIPGIQLCEPEAVSRAILPYSTL